MIGEMVIHSYLNVSFLQSTLRMTRTYPTYDITTDYPGKRFVATRLVSIFQNFFNLKKASQKFFFFYLEINVFA